MKTTEDIGLEIARMREDRVKNIQEIIMKKYNLTKKQYEEALQESY